MSRTDCNMFKAEFKVMERMKETNHITTHSINERHTLLTLSSLSKIDHAKMCILKCQKTLQKQPITFVCPSVQTLWNLSTAEVLVTLTKALLEANDHGKETLERY